MLASTAANKSAGFFRSPTSARTAFGLLWLAGLFGGCAAEPAKEADGVVSTTTGADTQSTETQLQECVVGRVGCACSAFGSPCDAGLYCVAQVCSEHQGDDSTSTTTSTVLETISTIDPGTTTDTATTDTATTTLGDSESTADTNDTVTPTDSSGESTDDTSTASDAMCSKVDFLFVVDNSTSMKDEEKHLADSMPAFIDVLANQLQVEDAHFMVVDTGFDKQYVCSTGKCHCRLPLGNESLGCCPEVCAEPENETCNEWKCASFSDTCDFRKGSGRTFNINYKRCGFVSGERFVTGTQTNVQEALECAVNTGVDGSDTEMLVQTMSSAIAGSDPELAACNQSFLRDDAVLFVVFVTDEDDKETVGSPGTPKEWVANLKAVKHNDPDGIVMLGLYGDTGQPNDLCFPLLPGDFHGAEESPRLREFVEGFGEYGHSASVCAEDYRPAFEQGFVLLEKACSSRRERLKKAR